MFRCRTFHTFDGDATIGSLGETEVSAQPVDVGAIEQTDIGRLAMHPLEPLSVPLGTIAVELLFAIMRCGIAMCEEVADDVVGIVEVAVLGGDNLGLFFGGFRTIIELGHQCGSVDTTKAYTKHVDATADGVETETIGICGSASTE